MNDDTRMDLDRFLPYQVSVLAGRLSRGLETRYRAQSGLGIPEWRILCHLSRADDIGLGDLTVRVDMHVSRVSRAVTRLERTGYIARRYNDEDRRRLCLRITDDGRNVMNKLAPLANEYQREIIEMLDDARGFRSGLECLLGKLES